MRFANGRKRALALAAGSVMISAFGALTAQGATDTWTTTGAAGSQDWFSAVNWNTGIPGSGDTALFSTFNPPSGTVLISHDTSVGAILDQISPTVATSLTVNGTSNLTLYGQNATITELGGGTFTQANTIIANTSNLATIKSLNFGANVNMVLHGPQSYILGSDGSGTASGQTITIAGAISNGPGTSALTYLGGGTISSSGGTLILGATGSTALNSFTGGLTIGIADTVNGGNQGGTLDVKSVGALPTTGTITVNEASQILFDAAGNYGSAHQILDIEGIGENTNSSGVLRTGFGSAAGVVNWLGDVHVGTAVAADATSGFVKISATKTPNRVIRFSGAVSGGSISVQGSGMLDFAGNNAGWTGSLSIGNGVAQVENGSNIGSGDLTIFGSSTNVPVVNLYNAAQTIRSLSSNFTATTGTLTQALNLGGDPNNPGNPACALTINQAQDATFGYGAESNLTTTIAGPGSIILGAAATKRLSLTGPNTYSGGTTVNGGILNLANPSGSATGTNSVTVNNGGTLASGGNVTVFGAPATTGSMSGALIVSSGGKVAPGNAGLVGTLNVGSLTARTGSIFNFDLAGGTSANADALNVAGAATLDNGGTETLNVLGDKLAYGTYQLMNFGNPLTNGGTQFTLGTTPAGTNRTYSISTSNTGVVLTILDTGRERYWSVGGGNPAIDGAGAWTNGSGGNFFLSNPDVNNSSYDNTSNNPVIIGNGGNGGFITLGGNVRVGGALVFSAVTSPYTIGAAGDSNTLQMAGGISSTANATINAPVILETSQTFTASSGTTVTLNGGISESAPGSALTKDDAGKVILNGTSTYTGGTIVTNGVLQVTTASLPSTGGVNNNASLVFSQAVNGNYGGAISGTGSVTIANTLPGATITLNPGNTYSGATNIQGGILSVGDISAMGTGAGGITLSGGTLQASADLNFPAGSPLRNVTLAPASTSTIDTQNHHITLGKSLQGAGNLTKSGSGTLTLTGLQTTFVIGNVAVNAGTIEFAPTGANISFGISASDTPNTINGNLTVVNPMGLRLYGGSFTGTGAINVLPNNTLIDEHFANNGIGESVATIGVPINLNPSNTPAFTTQFSAGTGNQLIISGNINGASDVAFIGGAGIVTLTGHSSYLGATTIDNTASTVAEVQIGIDNALPTATPTEVHVTHTGVLDLGTPGGSGHNLLVAGIDAGNTTGIIINEANTPAVLTLSSSNVETYSAVLTDGQSSNLGVTLAAQNTGSLTLNGSNSFTGPLTITGGQLVANSQYALGAPSMIYVGGAAGNSQLDFSAITGTFQWANITTLPNQSAPAAPITLLGLGGYNAGSGVTPGAIRVSSGSTLTLGSNINFAADASINVTSTSTAKFSGTLAGTGTLIKDGSGPLELSGNNAGYTGGTVVENGTLTADAGSGIGSGPLQVNNPNTGAGSVGADVILNLNNASQTVGSLSGYVLAPASGANTAQIVLGTNNTLTVNQTTDGIYAGVIQGATGSIIKSGPASLTLNGVNTFGGSVSVTAGTLVVGASGALPAGKDIANAGSLVYAANSGAGNISGAGSTTINAGIVLSTGNFSQSVGLVNQGTTTINGSGVVGSITGSGVLNIGASGANTYTLKIAAGATAGTNSVGGLSINNGANLDITNNILNITYSGTDPFTTIKGYILSGYAGGAWNGAGIVSSSATSDAHHGVGYLDNGTNNVEVRYTLLGDTNLDGSINFTDLLALAQHYGQTGAVWSTGDTNYDGTINFTDLLNLAQNYGQTVPANSPDFSPSFAADWNLAVSEAAAVPEPTSFGLLAIGATGLLARRRRAAR